MKTRKHVPDMAEVERRHEEILAALDGCRNYVIVVVDKRDNLMAEAHFSNAERMVGILGAMSEIVAERLNEIGKWGDDAARVEKESAWIDPPGEEVERH